MDTLTHGILGALTGRCCTGNKKTTTVVAVTAVAAMVPDLDYLLFWVDSYRFITNWHRGISHSLIMAPIWALLVSLLMLPWVKNKLSFTRTFFLSCLGLTSHIFFDYLTIFGIQLFAPFSDQRYALGLLFDLDPWVTLLALLGITIALQKRRFFWHGLLAIAIYLGTAAYYRSQAWHALEVWSENVPYDGYRLHALPQPFFPWHWQLLVEYEETYEQALLSLHTDATWQAAKIVDNRKKSEQSQARKSNANATLATPSPEVLPAIRFEHFADTSRLQWRKLNKYGANSEAVFHAKTVWQQPAFTAFRRFAKYPVLYSVESQSKQTCVWYTDFRYLLPYLTPPFLYGMCQQNLEPDWRLYRLHHNREFEKELIR